MGEATTRPDKVVGFHFFYPASVMRLIEVVEGLETSEETLRRRRISRSRSARQPIQCGEAPGFVVNRILNSAVSEIWRVRDEEEIDVEEIDKVVQESKAAPDGPVLPRRPAGPGHGVPRGRAPAGAYGDRFYVSPKMKELVEAGNLGQKTGKGFYEHG